MKIIKLLDWTEFDPFWGELVDSNPFDKSDSSIVNSRVELPVRAVVAEAVIFNIVNGGPWPS